MKSIQYALLAVGIALGFACDMEVDNPVDFDLERIAELSCAAINNDSTVCIGETICSSTNHGVTTYRRAPPGGCNASETAIPTTNVGVACDAAGLITDDPECPDGCAGPITNQSTTAKCCTITKTCYDPPADVDEVEPAEPIE